MSPFLTSLITTTLLLGTSLAAQTAPFDPADYGRNHLLTRQTTGDAAAFIAASQGGAFEPISELSPQDENAILAQPIGRVDVLLRDRTTGEEGALTCTGALLGGGLVLTNDHCIPQDGTTEIIEASILMGYLSLDGAGAQRFAMDPTPIDSNQTLDYAILRVDPAAEASFGHVTIGAAPTQDAVTRVVIHHPLGRSQVMSRFRCLVLADRAGPPVVAHRCDTLPGSSGALLFDDRGVATALHRGGGLDVSDPTSFNMAIDMGVLMQASPALAASPAAQTTAHPEATQTQTGGMTTDQMNAILTGD